MITKQMHELINKRKNTNGNMSWLIEEIWKQELEVLTISLNETINYLNNAPKEEIEWNSEIWEELSAFWKSKELVEVMKGLMRKFPELKQSIECDVKYAEEALQNYGK